RGWVGWGNVGRARRRLHGVREDAQGVRAALDPHRRQQLRLRAGAGRRERGRAGGVGERGRDPGATKREHAADSPAHGGRSPRRRWGRRRRRWWTGWKWRRHRRRRGWSRRELVMSIAETMRVALEALRANKLRSFLTMLGIVIGVSAVIAMVALGRGAQQSVKDRIASLGTTLVTVVPGQFRGPGGVASGTDRRRLTIEDAQALDDRG